jgi:isopentenyl phosphate kinase
MNETQQPLPSPPVFLKLGGSLITEKNSPRTPRPEVISRLSGEIQAALQSDPRLRLVLGHGAGSFAHVPAKRHATRQGVRSREQWSGFVDVWYEASALNHIVMQALTTAGVRCVAFPPSASVVAQRGRFADWNIEPLLAALHAGLVPVVYGDVIFDREWGGTIFSTEDLFADLAPRLKPERILLAGREAGVYLDFPAREHLIPVITPQKYPEIKPILGASAGVDVTGGMATKVGNMLALVEDDPKLSVCVFSGEQAGAVQRALVGECRGTVIRY